MSESYENIVQATCYKTPFPYRVVNNVFSVERFSEAERLWPTRAQFDEVALEHYNFMFADMADRLNAEQKNFWYSFLSEDCAEVIRANLAVYGDVFIDRFHGNLDQIIFGAALLMESDNNSPRRGVSVIHQHHYHDPLWLLTILIYLDEDLLSPTILYGSKDNFVEQDIDHLAFIGCQTRQWRQIDELYEVAKIECIPNRMLSFLDGPLSFHSSQPEVVAHAEPGRARRVIRLHLSAPPSYSQLFYGVDLEDFRDALREPTDEELPLSWIKNDIKSIYGQPNVLPSSASIKFASRVKLPEWRNVFYPLDDRKDHRTQE